MLEREPVGSLTTIRRDVYRVVIALTRTIIDPLLAGQLAGAVYQDRSGNSIRASRPSQTN